MAIIDRIKFIWGKTSLRSLKRAEFSGFLILAHSSFTKSIYPYLKLLYFAYSKDISEYMV